MDYNTWIKVERVIRYREHPTRRHGTQRRPDRYYVIRTTRASRTSVFP